MIKVKNAFKNAINNKAIDKMDLRTLNFVNDLLDGKLTEKQKDREIKRIKKLATIGERIKAKIGS
jgi:ferritin